MPFKANKTHHGTEPECQQLLCNCTSERLMDFPAVDRFARVSARARYAFHNSHISGNYPRDYDGFEIGRHRSLDTNDHLKWSDSLPLCWWKVVHFAVDIGGPADLRDARKSENVLRRKGEQRNRCRERLTAIIPLLRDDRP